MVKLYGFCLTIAYIARPRHPYIESLPTLWYHIASQIWQLLQHYGFISIGQCKVKYFSLSFLEEAAKKLHIVLQCIYGHDFLSPHTTIALGVKNYPSACMSSCFDELLPYSLSSKKMSVSSIGRLTHKIASFLSLISTHSVNNFNNVWPLGHS